MTEKRFIPVFTGYEPYKLIGAKDNGKIITFEDMFDLLNSFSEENQKLKQEIEQLKHDASVLVQSNKDYRIENEQLKQDKKRLIGFLHRYKDVDVEEIDEVVLSKEYLDEWGELYYSER